MLKLDAMFNLFGLLLSFILTLMAQINPPAEAAAIDSPGNMMTSIAWEKGPYDVDLWCRAPNDNKGIGYSNRSGRTSNLLRDDLGTSGDDSPFNREDCFTRGLPAGEYVVNIHGYNIDRELPVTVEIRIANGGQSQLILKEQTTIRPKQERTVARFRIDAKGNVVPGSMSKVFVPLRSAKK